MQPSEFLKIVLIFILKISIFSSEQCILNEKQSSSCLLCGENYYQEDLLYFNRDPSKETYCLEKINQVFEKKIFVSSDATCGQLCDGTELQPYSSLELAILQTNIEAMKYKTSLLMFIIFSKEKTIFLKSLENREIYFFRRVNCSILIKPAICLDYPGKSGCFSIGERVKIIAKTNLFSFFILNYLELLNIELDARDMALPSSVACSVEDKICCSDFKAFINPFNPENNICGFSLNEGLLQHSLFNLEYAYDYETKLTPKLILTNVSFVNFLSFQNPQKRYSSLFRTVKSMPFTITITNLYLENCTFPSGILEITDGYLVADVFIMNEYQIENPLINDLMVVITGMIIKQYNPLWHLQLEDLEINSLLNLRNFRGLTILKDVELESVRLIRNQTGEFLVNSGFIYLDGDFDLFFNIKNVRLNLFEANYFIYFFSEKQNTKLDLEKLNSRNSAFNSFLSLKNCPSFSSKDLYFNGIFPYDSFIIFWNSDISLDNSFFENLTAKTNPYSEYPTFFKSITEYIISWTIQFTDASPYKIFTAKDSLNIFNLTIYNVQSAFCFIDSYHSMLTINLLDLTFNDLNLLTYLYVPLISVAPEKNITLKNVLFKGIKTNQIFFLLKPCMRSFFTNVTFLMVNSSYSNFIFIESRTFFQPFHTYYFDQVSFIDTNILFDDDFVESNGKYIVFTDYRTMGNGAEVVWKNSVAINVFYEKYYSISIIYYICSPNFTFSNVSIINVSNTNIIFHSITTQFSAFYIYHVQGEFRNFPIKSFLNTTSEFTGEVQLVNCSILAKNILGSGLIIINNARKVFMKQLYLLGNCVFDGILLFLGTEKIEKTLVEDIYFEGIPGLGGRTGGLNFQSSGISNIDEDSPPLLLGENSGFYKLIFKNLLNSAISVLKGSHLIIDRVSVDNIISNSGGAFNIDSKCRVFVKKFFIFNSSSNYDGGGIYLKASTLIMKNGVSMICRAAFPGLGGLAFVLGSNFVCSGIFNIYSISYSGGAIHSDGSNLIIKDSRFIYNLASLQGGTIKLKDGLLNMSNTSISISISNSRGSAIFSEASNIEINDCDLDSCRSNESGTITVLGASSEEKVFLRNVKFINNTAISAPLLSISDSKVILYSVIIKDNKAELGSLIYMYSSFLETAIKILSSSIYNNQVKLGDFFNVYEASVSLIDTKIDENDIKHVIFAYGPLSSVYIEKFIFINKKSKENGIGFIMFLEKSLISISNASFYCAFSIHVLNCLKCSTFFAKSFLIQDSVAFDGGALTLLETLTYISESSFINIRGSKFGAIKATSCELLIIELSNFINNSCESSLGCLIHARKLINIYNKEKKFNIVLKSSNFNQIKNVGIMISNIFTSISDCEFIGLQTGESQAILLKDNYYYFMENSSLEKFSELGGIQINVFDSNEYSFLGQIFVFSTKFQDCNSKTSGGGIAVLGKANLLFDGVNFYRCKTEKDGGAIFFSCTDPACRIFILSQTVFENNEAYFSGGAIMTMGFNISISRETTYFGNIALIGNNLASRPFKIIFRSLKNDSDYFDFLNYGLKDSLFEKGETTQKIEVPIGYPNNIALFVVDYFLNLLKNVDDKIVNLYLETNVSSLSLENYVGKINQGVVFMKNLYILADKIVDSVIVIAKVELSDDQLLTKELEFSLKTCYHGDIFRNKRCIECPINTYSLAKNPIAENKQECLTCPEGAKCEGGEKFFVDLNYWRQNNFSSFLVKCDSEGACLFNLENLNSECAEGYTGNICGLCKKDFSKISGQCFECFKTALSIINFLSGFIIFFGGLYLNKEAEFNRGKDKNEELAEQSVKLFINHMSYLTIISYINKNIQSSIPFNIRISLIFLEITPQSLFNIDCLVNIDNSSIKYGVQLVYIGLSPFVFTLMGYFSTLAIDIIMILIIRRKENNSFSLKCMKIKTLLERRFFKFDWILLEITILFVIILKNSYPTIIIRMLEVFRCQKINDHPQETYMIFMPDTKCYDENHIHYMVWGGAFLLFWGVGTPIFMLYLSRKGRKENMLASSGKLSESSTSFDKDYNRFASINKKVQPLDEKQYFEKTKSKFYSLIVFGYEPKFYFWESILILKKLSIIIVSIFYDFVDKRAFTAILVLTFLYFFYINEKHIIFTDSKIKKYESVSLVISIATFALSLLINISNDSSSVSTTVFLLIIILVNFYHLSTLVSELWRIKYIVVKRGTIKVINNIKHLSAFKAFGTGTADNLKESGKRSQHSVKVYPSKSKDF